MRHIFSNSFYLLFSLPNKKEVFELITNSKYVDRESSLKIRWNSNCKVKVEELYADKVGHLLVPSIELFLNHIGAKKSVSLLSIWKNTYNKDSYQDVHDHMDNTSEVSGCIFLDDQVDDASKFYFFNRHYVEISKNWKDIMKDNDNPSLHYYPNIKSGDIILFPSHILHGVTSHKLRRPRTTISFNLKFI